VSYLHFLKSPLDRQIGTPREYILDKLEILEKNMPKFATFGETMVQYNAKYLGPYNPKGDHILDVAGAESNVALNLSRITSGSVHALWISRLGNDEAGKLIADTLSQVIDISAPIRDREKTGISFLNHYDDDSHIKEYQRAGSAASNLSFEDVESHLPGSDLFHVTGITPALSASCRDATLKSMKRCLELNIPVCLDVNYRDQLWNPDEAKTVLNKMIGLSTVLKLGHDEAEAIWSEGRSAEEYARSFHQGSGTVTILTKGASGAILFDGENLIEEPSIEVRVVDPVGAGDAFVAGFIGTLFNDESTPRVALSQSPKKRKVIFERAIRVANICGSLTCTKRGDTSAMPNMAEVEHYLGGT
jgi:2-dehydro-3-deoxygluconokinase